MKSVCKIASALTAVASGAKVLRGSAEEDFVPVARDAHNTDESFRHTGPPAFWGNLSRPGGAENLCIDGHLVPELYVLGAPKAATTSLWMDTDKAGIKMPIHGLFMGKEFRFFLMQNLSEDLAPMKTKWLANMPECTVESREVVADFNPHNLASVPSAFNPKKTTGPGLPPVLQSLYADRASNLLFLVMLREPLSRMQSHWHMNKNTFPFVDYGAKTWGDSMTMLHRALQKQQQAGRIREWTWLWESMYGAHLPSWLQRFAAERFLIIPMKEYTQGSAQGICSELSSRLRFPIDCAGSDPSSLQRTNTNVHDHVGVESELGADLFQAFNEFLAPSNRQLYRAIATASAGGAYLANYEGGKGDVVAIRSWLHQGW